MALGHGSRQFDLTGLVAEFKRIGARNTTLQSAMRGLAKTMLQDASHSKDMDSYNQYLVPTIDNIDSVLFITYKTTGRLSLTLFG
jgi:hypothetical protein